MPSPTLSFSRDLRECRLAAGLSRAQVAREVHGAAELADLVADLGDGRIDPMTLSLRLRLATVLGVTLAELGVDRRTHRLRTPGDPAPAGGPVPSAVRAGGPRQYDACTMQHLVIDGFEHDLARVEWDGRVLDLPRAWLPRAAAEGDHLRAEVKEDGLVCLEIDASATRSARQAAQTQLDALNAQAPGGEIIL